MKRLFLFLLLATITLTFTSCDLFYTPPTQPNTDEYYVRYTIQSSFYYFGSISYADVNGTQRDRTGNYNNTSLLWEMTIGPVKKGFNSFVKYESGKADNVKIEVSKNGNPFVQKASGVNNASYKINF
jgi:hypothetical protein